MRLFSNLLLGVVVAGVIAVRGLGADAGAAQAPSLVPLPAKYQSAEGQFTLSPQSAIIADAAAKPVAEYLADLLTPAIGTKLSITLNQGPIDILAKSFIDIHIMPDQTQLGDEGYAIKINKENIEITAAKPAGAFYAVQTLRQMMPAEIESKTKLTGPITIAACTIEDSPRYPWRGALLDSCRHFFPKETVLRFIDLLAYHKMNTLQWHLTDDQGWRIQIKKYPLLTTIGAWRLDGATGTGTTQPAPNADGSPAQYGGFYTQDDIREIVAYAKARYVTIVPEIEMPGHAMAALASYPGLACTDGPFEVGTHWGVYKDVYDPSKEETFTFIENVLDEVCDLFPGDFVHIGGDECPKDRWKESDSCQALMKKLGLKNEDQFQSYFVQRIEKYLETKHKRLIGWNEILQGGLPEGAAVTIWQGMTGGHTAAVAGHDVVMCPQSNCYFDHTTVGTTNPKDGDFLSASTVPLNKVYAFEPTPPDLTPEQAKHILGAQGNLWSERIPTQDRLDYMEFPRMAALAEVLWTGNDRGDFPHFQARLVEHLKRLDALGVKYFDDPIAHAAMIGSWAPADMLTKTTKEIDYDAGAVVTAEGQYDLRFEYTDGKGRLDIDYAALLENGKEVSRDGHAGQAGGSSKGNGYRLSLDHLTPGATYTVRVGVEAKAGPDTKGQIFLVKGPAATQPVGPLP